MNNPKIERRGTKHWIKRWYNTQDQLHREDGPAVTSNNGYKAWYKNDKLHNENGPAQIYSSGLILWYVNGEKLSKKEFKQYKIKNFISND